MKNYDAATAEHLAARRGIVSRQLVWIAARNRETGAAEAMGLWTGEDDLTVTLGGQVRRYTGAGGLLQSEPVTSSAGLAVRMHRLQVSAVAPEVENLVRGYDTRFAPVEIHRALFDPETGALISAPHRVFRGLLNSVEFPTAEPGGAAVCVLEVASETRALTRTLASKKSDEMQRRRGGDRLRRYGDISGVVQVFWGERVYEPGPKNAVEKAADWVAR